PRPGLPTTGVARGSYPGRGMGQAFGETERSDDWWSLPLLQAIGLVVCFGYATWAALQGNHFRITEGGRDYLSPFYSPLLQFSWWRLSPALLILGAPVGFR